MATVCFVSTATFCIQASGALTITSCNRNTKSRNTITFSVAPHTHVRCPVAYKLWLADEVTFWSYWNKFSGSTYPLMGTNGFRWRVNRQGCELNHPPPSRSLVKNEHSSISDVVGENITLLPFTGIQLPDDTVMAANQRTNSYKTSYHSLLPHCRAPEHCTFELTYLKQ